LRELKCKNTKYAFLCSILLIFCTSCASYQDYSLPIQNEIPFSISGDCQTSTSWWTTLSDEKLNTHIDTALQNNFNLAAAWERLNAAREIARREASDLYPALDLDGDVTRTIDENSRRVDSFSAGPAASYEVDLWGRIRASAEAEDLRALASEEAYRTVALTLSGDIAITWVRLIEAHRQLSLLNSQINTNQKALEVLEVRFGAGQVRSEDILRQRLLIEAIREDKISVEAEIVTLEHQLAVLRGEEPQGKSFEPSTVLPVTPPLPEIGVPSELLNRRPDIRAALLEVEAADRDLAAAVRDQYPSITLSASYISEAATAGNLFSSWITSLAGGIVAPIFDGGQRRAEVSRREAERAELLNLYGQNVLEAFREVEDALIQEQKQKERIRNLEARLRLARETFEQIELGYFNGANEFISVLSAQTELQETERNLLRAKRELLEFRIVLYRALAGGFETPRDMPREKQNNEDI
jgi:NodT family efflux transporter outer membrane factor (OMF) lipoprotein